MHFFDLQTLATVILWAIGASAVITGSKIGYPIRFAWCFALPKALWGMVRCPYCNAWWSGLVVAIVFAPQLDWWPAWLQSAFSACGVVRVLQAALPGDGIAMVEDFEQVFDRRK